MSTQPSIPAVPEKDEHGGDDLPTYDDLVAQNGPNSRFGRWREWIEKRAAERYADLSLEALSQRRKKGWGEGVDRQLAPGEETHPELAATSSRHRELPPVPIPEHKLHSTPTVLSVAPLTLQPHFQLHIQTDLNAPIPISPPSHVAPKSAPTPSVGESLSPSHLEVHHFGSRFLPHTTSPIRCLLPLFGDRLLLIGHDDGLSVMDMYPNEWGEQGLVEKGPNDAGARPIWVGEGVFQMNILESESTGQGTPQGVVLALVGPESDSPKEQEAIRTLRMYNLASLVSLAKWSVVQKGGRPLDLRHPTSGKPTQTSPGKKHKSKPSLAKGLRNLVIDTPTTPIGYNPNLAKLESYTMLPSAVESPASSFRSSMYRIDSNDSSTTLDSSWDIVDDLPLRWASDYVPLASAGSRILHTSVLSYALWKDENSRSRGGAYLAIATKSNIFLYETPKGERAFHFVKEFYTPITARSLCFVYQAVQDPMSRSPSDASPSTRLGHHHHNSHSRHSKQLSVGHSSAQYPHQLSLFVIFEKKAGLIRIADAAVGEVELYDKNNCNSLLPPSGNAGSGSLGSLGRRSRSSWDGKGFHKEPKALWILPVKIVLPGPANRPSFSQSMYLLTRGKHSHILPYPLPANFSLFPPYRTISWSSPPAQVSTRVCYPMNGSPFLQAVAFGEEGVEVQEIPLSSLSERKGKGRAEEPIHAQTDVGGDTGFLCIGGQWHRDPQSDLLRVDSTASSDSTLSVENISNNASSRLRGEEGIYAWVRKGHEDWRVFWVGGCTE